MISQLVLARDDRDALSTDEIIGTAILLLFAGHETTLEPDRQRFPLFDEEPRPMGATCRRRALAASAVEEWLRYDGPSGALARVAAADVELGGKTIREGQRLFAFMNSANRDPAAIDDPERFDIGRTVNPHVTFGHGIHFFPWARHWLASKPRSPSRRSPNGSRGSGFPEGASRSGTIADPAWREEPPGDPELTPIP